MQLVHKISGAIQFLFGSIVLLLALMLFVTNIDIAYLDLGKEKDLDSYHGVVCEIDIKNETIELKICGSESVFYIENKATLFREVKDRLQVGSSISVRAREKVFGGHRVLELHTAGAEFDFNSIAASYRRMEARYLFLGCVFFLIGGYLVWRAKRLLLS